MKNKVLVGIKDAIPNFHAYFKHDNVLAVSEDESDLPFVYFIFDETYPNLVLLSIAVDYPNAINLADIVLKTSRLKSSIALAEPFFISSVDGITYLGDDAFNRWSVESSGLEKLTPLSQQLH